MGQRHNRRRTRSRPRHRNNNSNNNSNNPNSHSRASSVASSIDRIAEAEPPLPPLPLPIHRSATHWDEQYATWQARAQQQQEQKRLDDELEEEALEAQRLRVFGGELGDEVSLCEPMLRVVMHLFNGIDYVDP